MKYSEHRVGAMAYVLWGLLHVAGGAAMLVTLSRQGLDAVLEMFGWSAMADPAGTFAGILGFHAWNLLWVGALVVIVAMRLNWRNDSSGYWVNLVLVSCANLGAVLALVRPGHLELVETLPSIALWLLGVVFTTVARFRRQTYRDNI